MFRTLQRLLFPVLNALGPLLIILAIAHLIPVYIAYREEENVFLEFAYSGSISFVCGLFFLLTTKRFRRELEPRDGFLLVTLSWLSASLVGTMPLAFLLPEIPYYRIFFEAVSCLTTTGATALTNLGDLPLSLNYWRCLLSWLGGMGIIVLAVAILPLLGVGGAQLFKVEHSNLFKDDRLTPRIADTAKALWSIYILASVACAAAYHWAGMKWDDAIMFMFTTMSLSGISPYDQSIGYFNSPAIEMVAMAFIVFSGFNFSLHFTAWRQRSISRYFTDIEARAWILILLIGVVIVFTVLSLQQVYPSWEITLRHSVFNVVSLFSTTGYTTVNYDLWPSSLGFLLLITSVFASCSGSTGGGVKMIRVLIFVKQAFMCMNTLLRPRDYLPLRLGKHTISTSLAANVSAFFALHICVVFLSTLVIMFSGVGLTEALSTVIACIANTGPGLGAVGPAGNYAACNPVHLWVGSFCMFVGRLELFTVFVLFTRSFWRS